MSALRRRRRPGYRARRTLPLRVEAVRQLKRRRTLVMGGDPGRAALRADRRLRDRRRPGRRRQRPGHPDGHGHRVRARTSPPPACSSRRASCWWCRWRCSAGTRSPRRRAGPRCAICWPRPCPAPGCCGPSSRWRSASALAAMVLLPLVALAVGHGRVRLGPAAAAHRRLARRRRHACRGSRWSSAFIFVSQLVTAGLAFWLSTKTDAPLGAVGGAVGLTIVGNVLDAVTALGAWRDSCPRTGSSPGSTPSSRSWSGPAWSRARRSR